jgi:hypothetical protein
MYIGAIPTPAATESRQEFTATANQTVFSTTGGTVGYCDCFLNGVKMAASDFSFDGADVTLTSGAAAGDVLAVVMRQADNALVALPIKDSAGNNVLSEANGVVSLGGGVKNILNSGIAITIPSSGGSATYDFAIPSGVKYVALMGRDLSHTVSNYDIHICLGTSSGVVTSGYTGVGGYFGSSTAIEAATYGFMLFNNTASTTAQDAIWELYNLNGNEWMCKGIGNYGSYAPTLFAMSNGHVDLGGELTTVQLKVSSGVFDSGVLNILYY